MRDFSPYEVDSVIAVWMSQSGGVDFWPCRTDSATAVWTIQFAAEDFWTGEVNSESTVCLLMSQYGQHTDPVCDDTRLKHPDTVSEQFLNRTSTIIGAMQRT